MPCKPFGRRLGLDKQGLLTPTAGCVEPGMLLPVIFRRLASDHEPFVVTIDPLEFLARVLEI